MNNSAYEGLVLGVYVLIFLSALSATIFLFNSVYDYSEVAYKFSQNIPTNNLVTNVPPENQIILNGDELISYYFNYIKFDSYTNVEIEPGVTVRGEVKAASKYKVIISGIGLVSDNLTYNQLMSIIDVSKKYVLTYESLDASGVSTVRITEYVPIEE